MLFDFICQIIQLTCNSLSPVSTTRVDGPRTRLVETRARQHGPVLTGNGNRSPVISGRQLG